MHMILVCVCVLCVFFEMGARVNVFFFSQVLSEWKQLAISQRSTDRNVCTVYEYIVYLHFDHELKTIIIAKHLKRLSHF